MAALIDKLDVLDLPPLDGESEIDDVKEPPELLEDTLQVDGDPFDDATAENTPIREAEIHVEGAESGWLLDSDEAATLDVGGLDVVFAETKVLEDDEPDGAIGVDDLSLSEESVTADSGEEGPLADDEELREEDLPALDADDDGDVAEDELYDRSLLSDGEELRWDDRAWSRVPFVADTSDEPDDSGVLALLNDDGTQSARDVTWRRLEDSGRVMAAAYVPGDSVVLAVTSEDRAGALLVRVQPDGSARIIAEVEPLRVSGEEEEGESSFVAFLRWDQARSCLVVSGNFGAQSFAPARLEPRP